MSFFFRSYVLYKVCWVIKKIYDVWTGELGLLEVYNHIMILVHNEMYSNCWLHGQMVKWTIGDSVTEKQYVALHRVDKQRNSMKTTEWFKHGLVVFTKKMHHNVYWDGSWIFSRVTLVLAIVLHSKYGVTQTVISGFKSSCRFMLQRAICRLKQNVPSS